MLVAVEASAEGKGGAVSSPEGKERERGVVTGSGEKSRKM
jgi:hypothetical protein